MHGCAVEVDLVYVWLWDVGVRNRAELWPCAVGLETGGVYCVD